MEFVVVTGMSGAGKSEAIRTLEEMGYYCMDNLPPSLLPKFADLFLESNKHPMKVAVVVDIRGGEFFGHLSEALEELTSKGIDHKILFLEASDDVLVQRYKESRRTHPLQPEGSILNGILEEREILKDIKGKAYYMVDTSKFSVKMLEDELSKIFQDGIVDRNITVLITSFGFKNGILLDGDLVFDVRFLPNPFYIESLKNISGENEVTKQYVMKWTQTNIFINKVMEMLSFLMPYYVDEGKTQLSIGIGCTGGFHRSVAIANELGRQLNEQGQRTIVNHRDLNR